MCELATLLRSLKIDGRPVSFEHAVLISECVSEAPRDWALSLLGVRAGDGERVNASHTFFATGNLGERFSGTVHGAPGSSAWHVRLQGSGPLRKLRDVTVRGDSARSNVPERSDSH
jgi:hypothetical protein